MSYKLGVLVILVVWSIPPKKKLSQNEFIFPKFQGTQKNSDDIWMFRISSCFNIYYPLKNNMENIMEI